MVVITLVCAIVGVPDSNFVVKIDSNELVGHLKDATKETKGPSITCVACGLQLYLANQNGTWLPYDVNLDELFQTEGFLDQMEKMDASWKLGKPSLFGSGLFLGEDVVHVLVVLPQTVTSGKLNLRIRLTKFWKAFREDYTHTDLVAGNLIALPEDTFILGDKDLGSHIYVRHCYPQLWNVCLSALDHPKDRNLAILGNPGIGKTFFGYFILLHLARCKATVVYEPARRKDRFLFCGGTAVAGSNTDFDDILEMSETYYIVDAIAPINYAAKTILVMWPRPEIWSDFHKYDCKRFYGPVWTEQEIIQCRELMYSDRPLEWVMECYRNGAALHAMSCAMQWIRINRFC